jgi:uncharacterized protein (TIGR00369 family)
MQYQQSTLLVFWIILMSSDDHYRKLENMMHSAPIVQLTGARVVISHARAEIKIPVEHKLFHAAGALHGCIYFLALDNAAFFAANSLVEDVFVLTVNFNIYLTRPVSSGSVKAVACVVNTAKNQFIAESILYDSENKEIARGSGIFVKSKIKLTPEIGYK